MYVCLECNCLFEEPRKYHGERLEYFGIPCAESYLGCPDCGSAFAEARICDNCNQYITENYLKDDLGNRFCESHFTEFGVGEED